MTDPVIASQRRQGVLVKTNTELSGTLVNRRENRTRTIRPIKSSRLSTHTAWTYPTNVMPTSLTNARFHVTQSINEKRNATHSIKISITIAIDKVQG
ncbi:MAG: hypothetical protein ACTSUE_09780 [Promethearchaeota archaeon]